MAMTKLEKLKSLEDDPQEQVAFALQLLKTERKRQVLEVVLGRLAENPEPAARSPLVELYHYFDKDGPKTDPGAFLRADILKALRPIASREEISIYERAACTYEQMPSMHDARAAHLRAEGLKCLQEVDETRAEYHCVRLLADVETSQMSGEPALTAVRLLAEQGNYLPVYYYALQPGDKIEEVLGECIRSLKKLPPTLLALLVERFGASPSDIIIVGLVDLLLSHAEVASYTGFMINTLKTGTLRRYDLYRYLVMAIATRGSEELVKEMVDYARTEDDRRKLEILAENLPRLLNNKPGHRHALDFLNKYQR